MDKRDDTIKTLNTLLEINNDRIEGYETASKETEDHGLKALFGKFAQTSHKCKDELVSEINKLGGEPTEETKTTGKFFRAWMDVKAALTGNDREAILNSCEFGEDKAVDTYENALKDDVEYLTSEQVRMISAQHVLIDADHQEVKSMRDAVEANK